MRIAVVSFEFAGISSGGGIGTYSRNLAEMLTQRRHEVEVFTAGASGGRADESVCACVHHIGSDRRSFADQVASEFARSHSERSFDVVEGPEYGADASEIGRRFPETPLVVKLHTPASLISEIGATYRAPLWRLRFAAGALRRGRLPSWPPASEQSNLERDHARAADVVTGPSRAILSRFAGEWGLAPDRLMFVPNVFQVRADLQEIDPRTRTGRTTFLGRLEVRKGVIELASAIPLVCRELPGASFRFIGRSLPMPDRRREVKDIMLERIGKWRDRVEFIDAVPYEQIPAFLADTDLCVYPSVWENFPNVCLEAMAAARGVIGSSAGGMAEMIDHGRTGLLVPPRNPRAIAEAILELLRDPERRMAMGRAAREHVLTAYSPDVIGPLQEASYERAIARAAERNGRRSMV